MTEDVSDEPRVAHHGGPPPQIIRIYLGIVIVFVGAAVVGSIIANAAYTRHVQERSDKRHASEQAAREKQQKLTREQGLALFCGWIYDTWLDPKLGDTTSPRGARALKANLKFYQRIGCPPLPKDFPTG